MDLGTAARFARIGQAGALVLAGCTIGAFVLLSGRTTVAKAPDNESLALPKLDEKDEAKPVVAEPPDLAAVAERFGQIGNHPKVPELAADTNPGDKPPDVAPTPPPEQATLKYLGQVKFGLTKMALVLDGSKQRFVKVGDALGDGKVVEIDETKLVLGSGHDGGPDSAPKGNPRTLDLAPKSAEVVTRTTGGPGIQAPGAMSGMPGGGPTRLPDQTPRQGSASPVFKRPTPPGGGNNRAVPISGLTGQARGQRIQQMRDRLKATGQYKTDQELNSALAKMISEDPEMSRRDQSAAGGQDQ